MAQLSLRVLGPDNKTIGDFSVSEDLRVRDLIQKVLVRFGLAGETTEFDLLSLENGNTIRLPRDHSLARVGIQDHAVLKLVGWGRETQAPQDATLGNELLKELYAFRKFDRTAGVASHREPPGGDRDELRRQVAALEERVQSLTDILEQRTVRVPEEDRQSTAPHREKRSNEIEVVLTPDAFKPRVLARAESIEFIEDCRREERIWSGVCALLGGGVLGILSQVSLMPQASLTDAFTPSSVVLLALLVAGAGYSGVASRRFHRKAEKRMSDVSSRVYHPFGGLGEADVPGRRDRDEGEKAE